MIITDTDLILKLNKINMNEYFMFRYLPGTKERINQPSENNMVLITQNVPDHIRKEFETRLEKYQDDYANNRTTFNEI